jgi:hypothetical protein
MVKTKHFWGRSRVLKYGQVFPIFSEEDSDLNSIMWYSCGNGYPRIKREQKCIYAHRMVLQRMVGGEIYGLICDHINRDILDCRRENLKPTNATGNARNRDARSSSGFIGVVRHKRAGKWQAQIRMKGKLHYLGLFEDPRDAARAYNIAACNNGFTSRNDI